MKLALISDIHSNIIGLQLGIADALKNNVDEFVFLGDYITDGNADNEVLETVKKYSNHTILGNRERYIINFDSSKINFANYRTIASTHDNLTRENIEYIKTLESSKTIIINGYKILLIHGDLFGTITDGIETIFAKIIKQHEFDICLFGHFHRFFNVVYQNRHFISPGSIGQSVDTPTYKYVILNLMNGIDVELREFDVKETFDILIKQYKNTTYYKKNFIWCDLILRSIRDGKDYNFLFIDELNKHVKNINMNDYLQFNRYWETTYQKLLPILEIYSETKSTSSIFQDEQTTTNYINQ